MAQRVLVTGAADGIGLAIARGFSSAGAEVHVCDVAIDPAKRGKLLGEFASAHLVDVSDEESVAEMFETIRTDHGGLDVLVNNVGIAGPHAFVEHISSDDWNRVMQVNLGGAFYCLRQALPHMKTQRSGVVINISSCGTFTLPPKRSVYNVSKWAIEGLTKSLARELGPFNIRCNAILPGVMNNDRMLRIIARRATDEGRSQEDIAGDYLRYVPSGRLIEVEEIADAAVFLASSKARGITAQLLSVDAGLLYED